MSILSIIACLKELRFKEFRMVDKLTKNQLSDKNDGTKNILETFQGHLISYNSI